MQGRWLDAAIVLAAAGAIGGALLNGEMAWLHYLCKPLATLLLLARAWRVVTPVSRRYQRAVVIGLALSLVGDICLMLPVDAFVPGLAAFLLAHLAYITAFATRGRPTAWAWVSLVLLAYAACNLQGLWPHLPPAMRVPVIAYVVVLSTMAIIAWVRRLTAVPAMQASARWAAWGAAWFVVSDSVLAWDRFATPFALAPLAILATYYQAQWCMARSVERG